MKKTHILLSIAAIATMLTVNGQSINVNIEKSVVKWTGEKVTGFHTGNINLKEGSFTIAGNKITKGIFVMDMNSITNVDLTNAEYNNKLVGHLKSDDFFGVATYPTAKLVIKTSSAFVNNESKVTADLTIKGKTNPISFVVKKDKDIYSTTLKVDRTLYDVRYGSGKYFTDLGDKVIYDEFTLEITLVSE